MEEGTARRLLNHVRLVAGLFLSLIVLTSLLLTPSRTNASRSGSVWGRVPILEHYLLANNSASELQSTLGMSDGELAFLQELAALEAEQIDQLEMESIPIISDPGLTTAQKRAGIQSTDYNQRLVAILHASREAALQRLGEDTYNHLANWLDARWHQEQLEQRTLIAEHQSPVHSPISLQQSYPRTFEVYATRYDAGGAYYIALPDKCLKFANGGAMRCSDGYRYGQNYSVAITYEGKTVYATVGESGPWNVDDNYWSTLADPQPRRMFADLPLGVPAAQAAYFNGYNGGLDQFGRAVTSPVAIDISYAVAADLDLPSGNNKVTVTFLWTEGWDGPSSPEEPDQTVDASTPQPTSLPVTRFTTATPNADGSIIHVVQQGQTLIGIANVYGVDINELLELNNMKMESVILPGDEILVKQSDPTPTITPTKVPATATTAISATPEATATEVSPTSDQSVKSTTTGTVSPADNSSQIDLPLLVIAGVAVIGLALTLFGLFAKNSG